MAQRAESDIYKAWEHEVRRRGEGRCASCGAEQHLAPRFLVPLSAGGRLHPENGALFCLICDQARKAPASALDSPVCVWFSRELSARLSAYAEAGGESRSRVVDVAMESSLQRPSLWEEILLHQDPHPLDVKCNFRASRETYAQWCASVRERRLTVREALSSLLLFWLERSPRVCRTK